jgi:hypothetical protein
MDIDMNASDIIKLAEKHHTNNSSAWYCLSDARKCLERGEEEYAKKRALNSLLYSVGMFHPDYIKASKP